MKINKITKRKSINANMYIICSSTRFRLEALELPPEIIRIVGSEVGFFFLLGFWQNKTWTHPRHRQQVALCEIPVIVAIITGTYTVRA